MIRSIIGGSSSAFLLLVAQHVHGDTPAATVAFGLAAWLVSAPFAIIHARARQFAPACVATMTFVLVVLLVGEAPWLAHVGEAYFGLEVRKAWLATATLVATSSLFFGGILGVGFHCAARLGATWFALVFAAAWIVFEELLLWVVPYYPWLNLAATQLDFGDVSQVVSLLGQRGLALLIAFAGGSLGLAVSRSGGNARQRLMHFASAVGIVILVAGIGALRTPKGTVAASACTVALVDAGIEAGSQSSDVVLQRYGSFIQERAVVGASVVVWPESALPGDPGSDAAMGRRVTELAARAGRPLLTGGRRIAWSEDWQPEIYNSAFLIAPGEPQRTYDKRHLVPFAESWPLHVNQPNWWPVETTTPGSDQDFEADVWRVNGCALGVMICFEAEQPWLVSIRRRAGAETLLVLSNDAELPPTAAAREVREARLRALESGVPVVRAANRGVSGIIDPRGQFVVQGTGGVVSGHVPLPVFAAATVMSPIVTCAAGLIVLIAVALRVPKVRRLTRKLRCAPRSAL